MNTGVPSVQLVSHIGLSVIAMQCISAINKHLHDMLKRHGTILEKPAQQRLLAL